MSAVCPDKTRSLSCAITSSSSSAAEDWPSCSIVLIAKSSLFFTRNFRSEDTIVFQNSAPSARYEISNAQGLFWGDGGETEEALQHIQRLTKLIPKDGEIQLTTADVLLILNHSKQAKEAYKKGISLGARPRKELKALLFQGENEHDQ
jgi:tetratricopeptide (TPR) repeat protein